MGRKFIYMLWFAPLLLSACERPTDPANPVKPYPVYYSVTRASGTATPADGTAYTFVTYNKNSDGTFGPNTTHSTKANASSIDPAYHQQPVGYYAYLSDPAYSGILQPCDVDDAAGTKTGVVYGYVGRNAQMGQALYDGSFQTVCLYPAMPVTTISTTGSDRVLIHRSDSLYASEPFDVRVDGYEIFELDLTTADPNYGSNRPLIEVRSKILVEFIQGSDYQFELKNLRLTNPGEYGWYHPLFQVTGISYLSADPNDIYDKSTNPTKGNEVELVIVDDDDQTGAGDIYHNTHPDTEKGDRLYWTGDEVDDGFFFFSNDYTKDNLLQPGIAFDLSMNGSGFKITVPLTMNLQRGYAYRLRLTVESLVIRATFQVVDWKTGKTESDIGGEIPAILGYLTPKGWVLHGDMGGDIGR